MDGAPCLVRQLHVFHDIAISRIVEYTPMHGR
jgi:hypothetical protein